MIGPAPHTPDDIYCMYLQLNQAIWEWARRTGKCMLGTLDTHIIEMMHQYAHTVRDYLVGCGIPTTYDEAWVAKDNRIHLSSTGTWWRVHRYYLEVSILEPSTPDIWVGLNSRHAVWGDMDMGSMYEECCTVDEVVSAVHKIVAWVRAQAQCSNCYYSEGGDYMEGDGVQYCGLGRELLPQCKDYMGRDIYEATK